MMSLIRVWFTEAVGELGTASENPMENTLVVGIISSFGEDFSDDEDDEEEGAVVVV